MKTKANLAELVWEVGPPLVSKHIVETRHVQACSAISADFAAVARAEGFEAKTVRRNNHTVVIVMTAEGAIEVDLSAIQFEFKPDQSGRMDPVQAHAVEMARIIEIVKADPFKTIRLKEL